MHQVHFAIPLRVRPCDLLGGAVAEGPVDAVWVSTHYDVAMGNPCRLRKENL